MWVLGGVVEDSKVKFARSDVMGIMNAEGVDLVTSVRFLLAAFSS